MADREVQRRLVAILAADVEGYSRLMNQDEMLTVELLRKCRIITDKLIGKHNGRIANTAGDSIIAVFDSTVEALQAAVNIQKELEPMNANLSKDRRLLFRIGINLGDIILEGQDILGDGVNVAARLESLAEAGGICVSRSVYEQAHSNVEFQFEDMGEQKVKNIYNPVAAYRVLLDNLATTTPDVYSTRLHSSKLPSIAVLPFDNLSGDPDQEYFSDGITEDIITELSRIRQFFVIARNTTFTYKGRSVDIKAVANELGVRYVLEGSVRKAGIRVRITAQLIDGETGNHIWAERYDRELKDVFEVQDEITKTVIGAIEPELGAVERERAKTKPVESLDAWDFYQRGMACVYQTPSSEKIEEALDFFQRSIDCDPNFAPPHAGIAHCKYRQMVQGFADSPTVRNEALQFGKKAVELDYSDAVAHVGLCSAYVGRREHSRAVREGEIAIELNPNNFHGRMWLGAALVWSGRAKDAIPHLEMALKLNPHDPMISQTISRLAEAKMFLGDFKAAAKIALRAVTNRNALIFVNTTLVSALAHAEADADLVEARKELLDRMPTITCEYVRQNFPISDIKSMEVYIDGLRKAGLPDS